MLYGEDVDFVYALLHAMVLDCRAVHNIHCACKYVVRGCRSKVAHGTHCVVRTVLFLSFVVDETYFKVPRHADCLKSHGRSRETISPLPHEGVENGSIAKGPREDSAWSEKLELA